jgi:NAD(P)-dependent dehydrogenase (short-subunit alcohol dehydrogenase family)
MEVNVKSMMLMSGAVVPAMEAAGGAAIVNLSSAAGLRVGHPALLYATTKGAVVNLTRTMAGHHGPAGIRVNCVAPGMVHTPMVTSRGMTPELRRRRRERSLPQTEGTGWDVGAAMLFLASDLARCSPWTPATPRSLPLPTPPRR